MASQKKIDANRRNGSKGRGPRSAKGKSRSRLNARKHGLSIRIRADRNLHGDVWQIARAIAGEGANNAIVEQALIVAETELQLQQIQQARRTAIELEMQREEAGAVDALDAPSRHSASQPTEQECCASAVVRALPVLQNIERYERRVYSRRAKALLRLKGLHLIAKCCAEPLDPPPDSGRTPWPPPPMITTS